MGGSWCRAKSGRTCFKPVATEAEMRHALYHEANIGWCLACGTETDGVEPDSRRYKCENCGEMLVYGLEELVMMNLVHITEEAAK